MEFTTPSLLIRPFSVSDREAMIDLFTDDVVKQTYMLPDFPCREDAGKLFDRIMELSLTPDKYVGAIILDGNCIGMVNETGREGGQIEVGYALLPRFHGQGYGTEMLKGTISYLFAHGFSEVIAGAFEENPASLRVMIKAGMEMIDKTDEIEYRGAVHHCIYTRILAPKK